MSSKSFFDEITYMISKSKAIKNAGIILKVLCKDGILRILVVQLKKGKWTNPAGIIEHNEDPFDAAKREFTEETGLELPPIDDLGPDGKMKHFMFYHKNGYCTVLYYGTTSVDDSIFILNNKHIQFNNETIDLKLYTYETILENARMYKSYFIKSLKLVYPKSMEGGSIFTKYIKYFTKCHNLMNKLNNSNAHCY